MKQYIIILLKILLQLGKQLKDHLFTHEYFAIEVLEQSIMSELY